MNSRILTDDAMIVVTDKIKRRRMNQRRLDQALSKSELMIRWDNPGNFGESYTSIMVPKALLESIIKEHFNKLIADDDTSNIVCFRKKLSVIQE